RGRTRASQLRTRGAALRSRAEGRFRAARRTRGERSGSAVIDRTTVQNVTDDARWILQAQLADGAIANYVDRRAIWPYLSNFAAMGLARATEVTGNTVFAQASWRWLHWYAAHEGDHGFVTDYEATSGRPVSTGNADP